MHTKNTMIMSPCSLWRATTLSLAVVFSGGCGGVTRSGGEVQGGDAPHSSVREHRIEPTPEPEKILQAKSRSIVKQKLSIGTVRPVLDGGDKSAPQCLADVRKAYRSLKRGDLELSRGLLEKSLIECPHYAPAHYDLAWIHVARGDQGAALSSLQKALEANYVRYFEYMRNDKALDPLRESDGWAEFETKVESIRRAWVAALSEPGAFVLLGHDDLRAVHIFDEDRNLLPERPPIGTVARARGQLFYYHRASGKLLPLSRDRRVGGFLVDRERRRVDFYSWKRLKVSHGYMYETHPVGVEYLPEEGWLSKVSLSSLDLTNLTLSEPMSLGGDYGIKRLARCGDRFILARTYADGTPFEEVTPAGLRKLGDMTLAEFERCDDELDVVGPRLEPMLTRRRCEDLPTGQSGQSGQSGELERLCLSRNDLYRPFRRLEGPNGEALLEGPAIVQLEATAELSSEREAAVEPQGLTCDSIDSVRRVSKAELSGFHCEARDVATNGRYAFVASAICGVMIWDLANPAEPQRVGLLYTGSRAYTVALKGRHLLVGDGGGLDAVEVSNPVVSESAPRSPRLAGSATGGREFHVYDMVIAGDTAYTASRGLGLHLFDISDWTQPRYLKAVPGAGNVEKLVLEGTKLRVRNQGSYSRSSVPDRLFDVSDPRAPRVISKAVPRRPMSPRVVTKGYEITASSKGLTVHRVSDAGLKTKVAFVKLSGTPRDLAVEGRYALVASNPTWLHVVELCSAE